MSVDVPRRIGGESLASLKSQEKVQPLHGSETLEGCKYHITAFFTRPDLLIAFKMIYIYLLYSYSDF